MKYYTNVQELIGNTPLLELSSYSNDNGARLFAKLEFFNPGGSVKDRLGIELFREGEISGKR